MDRSLLIIYLIYGFVYILFGFRIWTVNKQNVQNVYLIKSFKYIALFGIIHGISEWLTVLRLSSLYLDYDVLIINIKHLFKMFSFVFLMQFGINIIYNLKLKYKVILYLPSVFAFIYLVIYIVLLSVNGQNYFVNNHSFNIIYNRYFLGLLGSFIAAYGIYIEAKTIQSPKSILKRRYIYLMIAFIVYGIVDGLIVRQTDFFPGNIINNYNFFILFGFRVQYIKIIIGITLYVFIAKVIQSLNDELSQALNNLKIESIEMDSRCKIGFEMHDLIVQDIYGIKLKILSQVKQNKDNKALKTIQCDIEEALKKTRKFMQEQTFKRMNFQDLLDKVMNLQHILKHSRTVDINLSTDNNIDQSQFKESLVMTQLYFSLQEAILNAYKHANATKIEVFITLKDEQLVIKVQDNGIGIDLEKIDTQISFGIMSMKQRIESINGKLIITNNKTGTQVTFKVPIEGVS